MLANGIPKSGTYFLHKLVESLRRWHGLRLHLIPGELYTMPVSGDFEYRSIPSSLAVRRIQNGQFMPAHLPYSEGLESAIARTSESRDLRHILFIRDPRDTLVSYMRYVTHSTSYQRTEVARRRQRHLRGLASDSERLAFVMRERLDNYSIKYDYSSYSPWLRSEHCHVIRFEEIYREFEQSSEQPVGSVLSNLLDYLDVDLSREEIVALRQLVFRQGFTASGASSIIGQYRRYFGKTHLALFSEPLFQRGMEALGYDPKS